MKRRWLDGLKTMGFLIGAVVVCALILHIPAVDRRLTDWIGSPLDREKDNARILIADMDQPLPLDKAPYVYEADGRLMLLYGRNYSEEQGEAYDITPEGVNIAFYATKHNITEELRMRKQCVVRDDGKQMLFLLQNHDIPTLFLTDLTTMTTSLVATNVDSFLFVGNRVVYACGYARSNQLYVYDGIAVSKLAENVQSVALSTGDAVASVDQDGKLLLHRLTQGTTIELANGVLELYVASSWAANVTEPTVFCRKQDGDYAITMTGETRQEAGIPQVVGKQGDLAFTFCESEGALYAGEERLFETMGFIYAVLDWNELSQEMLISNGTGIYLLYLENLDAVNAVKVLSYTGDFKIYKQNPTMIRMFLSANRVGAEHVYIQAVSGRSFILNRSNPESWMNFGSSYLYGLWCVNIGSRKAVACDVYASRTIQPLLIRGRTVAYLSTYDDGSVRSVTTIEVGRVLAKDLLATYGTAKGQIRIEATQAGNLYFTFTPRNEDSVYSRLSDDGKSAVAIDKRVVSSFGLEYELE